IITNAVCHRSYLSPGKVQVELYDDRLEVTSPGMLDTELTIEQMKTGLSRIRNRGIAEVFAYMHMIEGWGSGIPDMFMDAKQYGLPEPALEDRGSDFRVNLYRRTLKTDLFGVVNPKNTGDNENNGGTNGTNHGTNGTNPESATDTERLIVFIRANENITQKELAKETGFSLRTVKRMVAELKKTGRIERIGSNRSGKWEVKD
ncbi:MAG: winged helix-turn-helix transcriptional regulator, partial [Lachnospiraceae bacterium]|nr:winged helix-turn-helix transcriptional regulator [Lachnospiraceae bacterium]